MGTRHENSRG